jgi:hypothetical protein
MRHQWNFGAVVTWQRSTSACRARLQLTVHLGQLFWGWTLWDAERRRAS